MLRTALRSSLFRPTVLGPNRIFAARFLNHEAHEQIKNAVSSSPVVLFMKGTPSHPECGFSRAAIQVLQLQQVPDEKLKTYNVLADPELRTAIKEYSDWPTIPQLYVNGEFVGGCDILLSMHQSGELETFLENNNVIPKVEGEAVPATA
ncbi:thioredoxin-like protein [Mycena haematopus]|nr:thioredoxin-like protein [Mycena haematopus]